MGLCVLEPPEASLLDVLEEFGDTIVGHLEGVLPPSVVDAGIARRQVRGAAGTPRGSRVPYLGIFHSSASLALGFAG